MDATVVRFWARASGQLQKQYFLCFAWLWLFFFRSCACIRGSWNLNGYKIGLLNLWNPVWQRLDGSRGKNLTMQKFAQKIMDSFLWGKMSPWFILQLSDTCTTKCSCSTISQAAGSGFTLKLCWLCCHSKWTRAETRWSLKCHCV